MWRARAAGYDVNGVDDDDDADDVNTIETRN